MALVRTSSLLSLAYHSAGSWREWKNPAAVWSLCLKAWLHCVLVSQNIIF